MPETWGMKRNRQRETWMLIGHMHIRTGLPNAFFVLWFPLTATMETVLFSVKYSYATWWQSVSKTRSALPHPAPPPPPTLYITWLQNMQTDGASPDSVPASDASPQLQTNSVSPAHFCCCGFTQSSVCINAIIHFKTFAYTGQKTTFFLFFQKYLFCSHCSYHKESHMACTKFVTIHKKRIKRWGGSG